MPPPPKIGFLVLVGAVMVTAGMVQLARHLRGGSAWRRSEGARSEEDAAFAAGQHGRRRTTAVLLILLGILVPLGRLAFVQQAPVARGVRMTYWVGMLALVGGLLIVSVVDLAKTGMRTRRALAKVRAEQAHLEQAIARKSRLPSRSADKP